MILFSDNQNKLLLDVGELIKKTQKLSEFNLFLRLFSFKSSILNIFKRRITSSANFGKFAECLLSKLAQITTFSLGLSSEFSNIFKKNS